MKRFLRVSWEFCSRIVIRFVDSGGLQHAGTMSFFALLSILPFIIITVGIVANLVDVAPVQGGDSRTLDQVMDPLREAIPFLDGTIQDLIASLSNTHTSLSIMSTCMLIFAATAVFNAITDGVNAMLQTERQRHYLVTKLLLAGMIITIAAAIFAWQLAKQLMHSWSDILGLEVPAFVAQIAPIELGVTMVILGVGFYLLVKFTATERYPREYRWAGAWAFVAFFLLGQKLMGVYFEEIASYERYYGTAGAFFGLSLWLYVASIIFLGACVVIRVLEEMWPRTSSGPASGLSEDDAGGDEVGGPDGLGDLAGGAGGAEEVGGAADVDPP